MNDQPANIEKCQESIVASQRLMAARSNEQVIRDSFTSFLRQIFPTSPSWVTRHIQTPERLVRVTRADREARGFIDNLVDLTAIEYEADLRKRELFESGRDQLKDYCASLINEGNNPELVLAVLSDTVRWRAFRVSLVAPVEARRVASADVQLDEIEAIDASQADSAAALRMIDFLVRYLGRIGSRRLTAHSIALDFGLDSEFYGRHVSALTAVVARAFDEKPEYATLIKQLWLSFVASAHEKGATATFDMEGYADELYLLTLAKLICANVIERKALLSTPGELAKILDGHFFRTKGVLNLVEYDYFGWLTRPPYLQLLLPLAQQLQLDLRAYDFTRSLAEDLFGRTMAQLARRTQRLLLGQEWTPTWLARHVVGKVLDGLPAGVTPQLVDMCCGSGAMVVATIYRLKQQADLRHHLTPVERVKLLQRAITGFDIDPLAVMLAKVNWVLAAQDWLEPFGTTELTIPIYHADSLFAITPLSYHPEQESAAGYYTLSVLEHQLQLPSFLITPEYQELFDELIGLAHETAMASSRSSKLYLSDADVKSTLASLPTGKLTEQQVEAAGTFFRDFVVMLDQLVREGRNGLWAFIFRNCYRPSLLTGQFNGIVSNPPWLALSKIADNPYKEALQERAEAFNIKPPGSSFLHIELATTFLIHAVDRYLTDNASVGCILPDTVLNGHHHNPFRLGAYAKARKPVQLSLDAIWKVARGAFRNEAIVLFGHKRAHITQHTIAGGLIEVKGLSPFDFTLVERGRRVAWSDSVTRLPGQEGFFRPAAFQQGADIMPRTFYFHEAQQVSRSDGSRAWQVSPIDPVASPLGFLRKDAKEYPDFNISPVVVSDEWMFDVLTSKLLIPFNLGNPVKALLPIKRSRAGGWQPVTEVSLASRAQNAGAKTAFGEMVDKHREAEDLQGLFAQLNARNKLAQQNIEAKGYLVFTGAGGKWVCAAYKPVSHYNIEKLIVDQTLYWAQVDSEEEAIYLTGLFNSGAINKVIEDFQPRGAFGERHVHTLAHTSTPPYDPEQVAHQDVVEQTRHLLAELEQSQQEDLEWEKVLDPNRRLQDRRTKARQLVSSLPSYGAYESACKSLYAV